jgi:hypothetical protein
MPSLVNRLRKWKSTVSGADEQAGSGFAVAVALGDELGDLELLGSQIDAGAGIALARGLAERHASAH